jgi:hypothetical protein
VAENSIYDMKWGANTFTNFSHFFTFRFKLSMGIPIAVACAVRRCFGRLWSRGKGATRRVMGRFFFPRKMDQNWG